MTRMTVAEYKASIQGRQNRAQGLAFEDIVSTSCDCYKLLGLAYIEKTPEPMKPIKVLDRQRGIFKAVFEKAAQPDYKGTLKGGRAIAFEAKHTETDRIQQKAVTEDQWDSLDLHESMGACCFVLVSLGWKYYRVPWAKWKTMKEDCGHKYMNAEDLSPYQIGAWPSPLQFLTGVAKQFPITSTPAECSDPHFTQP